MSTVWRPGWAVPLVGQTALPRAVGVHHPDLAACHKGDARTVWRKFKMIEILTTAQQWCQADAVLIHDIDSIGRTACVRLADRHKGDAAAVGRPDGGALRAGAICEASEAGAASVRDADVVAGGLLARQLHRKAI